MLSHNKSTLDLKIFLVIITILVTLGFLFIYSSSCVYAAEKLGASNYFLKKQTIGLLLAIITLLCAQAVPLWLTRSLSSIFFGGSLALTCLGFIPGLAVTIHGSSRWLSLGGLIFQPSELLKLSWLILLAHLLAKKERALSRRPHTYLLIISLTTLAAITLLKQPDFGMATLLVITTLLLLFIMRVNMKHLTITAGILAPTALLLIILKPYRLQRILTFLHPWQDPHGAGFQIIQSLIALGSGGWWGLGIAQSKQKFFYLPMQHTDFIFSIIVEETGFVGATIVIILYALLLYLGLRIAWKSQDNFSRILIIGCTLLISLQALMHLSVTTGLMPTKGIGLPFISYGKSSLISLFAMVGLIINATKNKSSGYEKKQ